MSKSPSLQDPFLNALRKERIPVAVYLVNGIKLQGNVDSFDQFVIVLRNNSVNQMVYKHAISTIVPARAVRLHNPETGEESCTIGALSSEEGSHNAHNPHSGHASEGN